MSCYTKKDRLPAILIKGPFVLSSTAYKLYQAAKLKVSRGEDIPLCN